MTARRELDRRSVLAGAASGLFVGGALGFVAGRPLGDEQSAVASRPTPRPDPPPSSAPTPRAAPPAERRPPFGYHSYAQQGEDLVMKNLLDMAGFTKPTYLDVGAHHPIKDNNTFLFYTQGARGVLVEPNPAYAAMLREARPGDVVVEAGIGTTAQTDADYYVVDGDGQLNTFSKTQADELVTHGGRRIEKVIKRALFKIDAVIETHLGGKAPDLLSLDVEGMDLAILQTLDMKRFRPKVVCVETVELATARVARPILALLEKNRYSVRGGSFANTIFIADELLAVYAKLEPR